MNQDLLNDFAAKWKGDPHVSPEVADKMISWITNAEPVARHRMNVYRVAADIEIPAADLVPAFLYGIKAGLFNLHWDVHCPQCTMVTNELEDLSYAEHTDHCEMCGQNFEVDFSERVEVTFSLNYDIEKLDLPPVCIPPKQLKPKFELQAMNGETPNGTEYLNPGPYRYICPITLSKGLLTIEGEPSEEIQKVTIEQISDSRFDPPEMKLRPGPVEIEFKNHAYPVAGLYLYRDDLSEPIDFKDLPRYLTGLDLIHYPEFKQLFGDQVLSARERMQISSVAILFTDITGSTAMYEKLGDAKAYNVVRDHYDILFASIEKKGGRVVKTIGDAVMASFQTTLPALEAVLDAMKEFDSYNTEKPWPVKIKIGLHSGPAILVNLNNNLDYFGSTVNRAARIQGVSGSGEISFSDSVLNDAGIKNTLVQSGMKTLRRRRMILKGIDEPQTVYTTSMLKDEAAVVS